MSPDFGLGMFVGAVAMLGGILLASARRGAQREVLRAGRDRVAVDCRRRASTRAIATPKLWRVK